MPQQERDLSSEIWAITGAAGKVGSTLREGLLPLVKGLVLLDAVPISDVRERESAVVATVQDAVALREAFSGVDGIIHLAAIPDEADFHDLAEVNIVGGWHVFEAARQAGVRRVVLASTGRTMGMNDVETVVGPADRPRPDGLYAVSKVASEAIASLYVDKFGFTATAVRIGAFKPLPIDSRDMAVWLSEGDAVRAFVAGMRQREHTFEIVLAYSNNSGSWVDLEPGRHLGYVPLDDASEVADYPPVTEGVQAGDLGTPEFTLIRQRPFEALE